MTRRTRFTLRERMGRCHDLPPRVAKTNGSRPHESSPTPSMGCAQVEICPMVRGRCRTSPAIRRTRSMSVPVAGRTWHHRRRILSPGERRPGMAPRWEWTRVDTGTRDAFRNSDEAVRSERGPVHNELAPSQWCGRSESLDLSAASSSTATPWCPRSSLLRPERRWLSCQRRWLR